MPNSLFTYSSETAGTIIAKLDALLIPYGLGTLYFFYYLFIIGFFIFLYPAAKRLLKERRACKLLVVILFIFFIRLLFLENPFAWEIYQRFLTQQNIGYRETDIIATQIERFKGSLMPKPTDFLAVGSSQVGAIYYHWGGPPLDLKIYSVAGMKPIDYLLYRDELQKYRPRNILLYLSEFDMAVTPQIEAVLLGPRQGFNSIGIWKKIIKCGLWNEYKNMLPHSILAELVPEFKYSFIFRGLARQLWGPEPAQANINLPAHPKDPAALESELLNQVDLFTRVLSDRGTQFNTECLRDFVVFCAERNIQIIIVEGQYNPLAYTPKALIYNQKIREKFYSLQKDFKNVRFILRTQCYVFQSPEYIDISHVVPDAARKFTKELSLSLSGR